MRKREKVILVKSVQAPVNSIVDDYHAGHWQPEGEERGEDGVGDVWVENAFRIASSHLLDV